MITKGECKKEINNINGKAADEIWKRYDRIMKNNAFGWTHPLSYNYECSIWKKIEDYFRIRR